MLANTPLQFNVHLTYHTEDHYSAQFTATAIPNDDTVDGIFPIFYAEGRTPDAALTSLAKQFTTHEDIIQ